MPGRPEKKNKVLEPQKLFLWVYMSPASVVVPKIRKKDLKKITSKLIFNTGIIIN